MPLQKTKETIKVGDWVWLDKAICRVEKIHQFYFEKHDEKGEAGKKSHKEASVKPFVTSKFTKYLYKPGVVYLNYLIPLTPPQIRKLNAVIKKNPTWLKQLDASEPATFNRSDDSDILIRNKKDLKKIDAFMTFVKKGKTFSECQRELKKQGLSDLIEHDDSDSYLSLFTDGEYNHKKKGLIWNDAELYNRPEF